MTDLPTPYYGHGGIIIYRGDLFDVLPTLAGNSVDACVTDPPYGLGFMEKDWDVPGGIGNSPMRRRVETNAVNTGVSRQGGRQRSCADFQKRQNRDAQMMQAEAEQWAREVFRVLKPGAFLVAFGGTRTFHRMTCGIEDAGFEIRDCLSWLYGSGFPKSLNVGNGQGTALKPAWEPIILARKPCIGTVAANILRHSTGALNIDACRIDAEPGHHEPDENPRTKTHTGVEKNRDGNDLGRWPANVCLDKDVAEMLDEQSDELASGANPTRRSADKHRTIYGGWKGEQTCLRARGFNADGASRFYYVAKPSQKERNFGAANKHPTVKPVKLMRWLVKLVVPVNGVCLDPFTGSGTTGMACAYELRQFIGIEREPEYAELAKQRIAAVAPLFSGEVRGLHSHASHSSI